MPNNLKKTHAAVPASLGDSGSYSTGSNSNGSLTTKSTDDSLHNPMADTSPERTSKRAKDDAASPSTGTTQNTSATHKRRASGDGTSGSAPVYMTVSDPECAESVRRFGHYPIVRGDELPGADMDKTILEENTVVYLITDSLDDTNDSGVNTPDDLDETSEGSKEESKQGSFVTIFSIWNTMMGTSILAMPWTLKEAGFGFGIVLILFVAAIACYTAYLAITCTDDLRIIRRLGKMSYLDFADACEYHLGKAGRIISLIFSQLALVGATIVYYVLLSNFLYNTGVFIYERANGIDTSFNPNATGKYKDVICESFTDVAVDNALHDKTAQFVTQWNLDYAVSGQGGKNRELFNRLWSQTRTVPAWLLIILFPLISIRSPTFLGKFTALATVSVIYLFILICLKAGNWGFHMDSSVLQYRNSFPSLTGTCSMAFFIHNALHTIMRSQKHPEKNGRDIVIAFGFTTVTYMLFGVLFFASFPLVKDCIADNFLNNLTADIPVFIARLGLLFQMSTVFPMLVYVLRAQIMHAIFKKVYPGVIHVMVLHVILLALGLLFAMFFPSIGTIIRYVGAFCGFVYIFLLPPLITLMNKRILGRVQQPMRNESSLECASTNSPGSGPLIKIPAEIEQKQMWRDQRTKLLWWIRLIGYAIIMALGLANFIAQFIRQFL